MVNEQQQQQQQQQQAHEKTRQPQPQPQQHGTHGRALTRKRIPILVFFANIICYILYTQHYYYTEIFEREQS